MCHRHLVRPCIRRRRCVGLCFLPVDYLGGELGTEYGWEDCGMLAFSCGPEQRGVELAFPCERHEKGSGVRYWTDVEVSVCAGHISLGGGR
jgi:hypothetical protein